MSHLRSLFREERLVWWLLLAVAVIRVAAMLDKGVTYDGGFEDAIGYFEAARTLAATGTLSFYGTPHSAMVMPGYVAFLAAPMLLTSDRFTQYLLVKLALVLVSVGTVYVLYLLGRRIGGTRVGLGAAALLAASLPHVYTGTLTLSENPFTLALLVCTLAVIRLADEPGWRRLAVVVSAFVAAVYVRQTAVGFLVAALVYLLARRYPPRLLLRHAAVAVVVVALALAPWWVRNHRVFGTFIPFTSTGGAPLFEGTFQRFEPYRTGSFEAMDEVLRGFRGSELDESRLLAEAGRRRIRERLRTDPAGFAVTYLVMKPAAAWLLPFYWDKVFGISGYWVLRLHALLVAVGLPLLGWLSVRSRHRAEFLLLFVNVVVITAGASYYLGLSRYVYPYMPFVYVAAAYAVERGVSRIRSAHAGDEAARGEAA